MSHLIQRVDMRVLMVVIGALVLHLVMAISFILYNSSTEQAMEQRKKSLKDHWVEQNTDLRRERRLELQAHYGANPLDRIVYNPALDIQTVLRKLAEAVMPGYDIEVSVDRFTEFNVYVNVYNMPGEEKLAGFLKEIFSRVDPEYVYQFTFTDKDNFRIIDRRQLERVGDWKDADPSRIKRYCLSRR